MARPIPRRKPITAPQIMVLGFAGLILVGTLLLMLPISSSSGQVTPFLDSLFTATTSTCVTGLVVRDTGSYWSTFGHCVILLLIQIGGLGVITIAASFTMLTGRKLGLSQRSNMQEAVAAPKMGGISGLTKFLVATTLLVEALGAMFLAPAFIRDFGWGQGIWRAVFTSISAFCNAGIDLFGTTDVPYASMTAYLGDPLVNIALMALIIIGGLGFLTWDDIRTHKHRIRRYRMQSKVILCVTAGLILVPAVLFFLLEFAHLPLKERILASLFQSVTTRTAGMNTTNLTEMSQSSQFLMILLMLIGGSPGSTAGGMKTTTFAVLLGCAWAVFRKRDSVQFYGRRIGHEVVATAATLLVMYLGLAVSAAMLISVVEGLPLLTCLFESTSAIATVGLTLGITPGLGAVSKCILIILMYLGRIGGLTLIYATLSDKKQLGKLPMDKITVG
ncbi:MAG: Trk family potassium uptake protein [Oscillospiraceae bacterium]|nr:Trk family potassium uptake protein [Oscillospiraceae bacterium]